MKVFKQKNAPTCGPRSVQTALSHFGIHPSFRDIKKVCVTDSRGATLSKIQVAAQHFGLCVGRYLDDEVSINVITDTLDSGGLVLVHWFTGEGTTHIATAYKHDETSIYLADTASHLYTEPFIIMRKDMLKKCWNAHPDVRWLLSVNL